MKMIYKMKHLFITAIVLLQVVAQAQTASYEADPYYAPDHYATVQTVAYPPDKPYYFEYAVYLDEYHYKVSIKSKRLFRAMQISVQTPAGEYLPCKDVQAFMNRYFPQVTGNAYCLTD